MHPDWFAKDTIRVLVQLSTKGHDDLNKRGVPRAGDFARSDDDRKVIELVFSQGIFGRPYVLPPGVPPDRVAALRKAFVVALNDKSLRTEADKMQFDVDPMAGDELQKLVVRPLCHAAAPDRAGAASIDRQIVKCEAVAMMIVLLTILRGA